MEKVNFLRRKVEKLPYECPLQIYFRYFCIFQDPNMDTPNIDEFRPSPVLSVLGQIDEDEDRQRVKQTFSTQGQDDPRRNRNVYQGTFQGLIQS